MRYSVLVFCVWAWGCAAEAPTIGMIQHGASDTVEDGALHGCGDPSAENYDPDAAFDDGSCRYDRPERDKP